MRRREVPGALGAGAAGLAGCLGFGVRETDRTPPLVEDRPDAVYHPTHVEGMQMAGTAESGAYSCALTYSFPHRFWLVTGDRTEQVTVADEDTVHLMPVVWHTETGLVPPDANPQVTIRRDGEPPNSLSPWAMLSQPMGVHFGDNVALPSEGDYDVEVSVGEGSARRTGALADAGGATFEFTLSYSESKLDEISYDSLPEETQGTRGAVEPHEMGMVPGQRLPDPEGVPGTLRGTATSGDASFVVTTGADAPAAAGDGTYLAVSARTPHNRYRLPLMSLSATLTRDGETVSDDVLRATLDPDFGYHYGATVPAVESGDELAVTVDAPPQMARHEGYETAFLEMPPATLTL
jgi:hypothetical protein